MGRRTSQLVLLLAVAHAGHALAASSPAEITRAVHALEGDHDSATDAVYTLQEGGSVAAKALLDAWPSLSPLAQKRAIGALRPLAEEHSAAVDALVLGARSDDEDVRELSLAALRRIPNEGRNGLAALVEDPKVGDRAAAVLARNEPNAALPVLLDAMSADGGADRAPLRAALAVAVERADRPEPALASWLDGSPPQDAVASAALGLRGLVPEPLLSSYVRYALSRPAPFSTSWRLLQSVGDAGDDPRIDDWVKAQLIVDEPWMLRAAAVDAATARGFRESARPRLEDPYPRVRMRAVAALSGDSPSMLQRATLARKDAWPMVRAEAVRSLRGEPDALPVVVAAVDDSMSVVRAAAIEVLTDAPHDEGWDRVHGRLRKSNEWPVVTEAAIGYVVAHCRVDAAESLFRVVMRAAPSNALTDDLNNAALAVEALRILGTPEANAVIERLRATPGVPPTLKMALDAPSPNDGECANAKP
jgi:hypothetical protein